MARKVLGPGKEGWFTSAMKDLASQVYKEFA